jgi:hypothetical protein
MEGVKTEQQLEGKSKSEIPQEGEKSVKSDGMCCVSVGTQCEQDKDNDSIIVMKCSYSDSEDTVLRYREDSQGVSIITFCVLTVSLCCGYNEVPHRCDSYKFSR